MEENHIVFKMGIDKDMLVALVLSALVPTLISIPLVIKTGHFEILFFPSIIMLIIGIAANVILK